MFIFVRLALLLLLVLSPLAFAWPEPPCPPPLVEKIIPNKQILLVPHEHATTLPAWKLRAVEVGRPPCGPALDFQDEKRSVIEMKLQERDCEQLVTVMELKEYQVICPTTGKLITETKVCPVVKKVTVKVYETVPVAREVIVRVPVLKPGKDDRVTRALILDQLTEPAIKRGFTAVTSDNPLHVFTPKPGCLLPKHP